MELFQDIILSRWAITIALSFVFLLITRWAIVDLKEYPGYALGWTIALFIIIVHLSVREATDVSTLDEYLDGFQVFLSTILGLLTGGVIIVGLRFGMRYARAVALQVAIYTAMNITMIFLAFILAPVAQKMIGIFGLAIAIATLLAMVLFPSPVREQELNIRAQNSTRGQAVVPPVNNPNAPNQPNAGQGGGMPRTRLDEIRNNQQNRRR